MIKIEGFYFLVSDLQRALDFYQQLLGIKATHVEDDRWADFYAGDKYFGLLCDQNENQSRQVGNNSVLNCRSDNLEQDFKKAKDLGAKIINEISDTPDSPYEYLSFTIQDPDGNTIEVAQY